MQKILVFGNSGSGKSTFARSYSEQHNIKHLDLDSIVWEPGTIAVQRNPEAINESLQSFMASEPEWIIEGCYGELIQTAAASCTELIFLNPGLEACLANNRSRPWEPHKYESPEQQNAMLAVLEDWVTGYYHREDAWSYSAHRAIFDAHPGQKTEFTTCHAYSPTRHKT